MINVIIYKISQDEIMSIQKLVDALSTFFQDNAQGIVINEYSDEFLKATYWQKKRQKKSVLCLCFRFLFFCLMYLQQ